MFIGITHTSQVLQFATKEQALAVASSLKMVIRVNSDRVSEVYTPIQEPNGEDYELEWVFECNVHASRTL